MSTELHEDAIRSLLHDAVSDVDLSAELPARAERTYRRRQTRHHLTTAAVALAVVAGAAGVIGRMSTGNDGKTTVVANPGFGKAVDINTLTAMSFVDREHGFAVSEDTSELAATSDGGKTWKTVSEIPFGEWRTDRQVESRVSLAQVAFVDTKRGFVWGNDKLYFSDDGGRTWVVREVGLPVDDVKPAGTRVWALVGCQNRGPSLCMPHVVVSDDAGATWATSVTPRTQTTQTEGARALAAVDERTAYTVTGTDVADTAQTVGLAVTHDGGASWLEHDVPCSVTFGALVAVSEAGQLWVACSAPGPSGAVDPPSRDSVLRSTDDGAHWQTAMTDADLANLGIIEISVAGENPVVVTAGATFVSTNAGASWQRIGPTTFVESLATTTRGVGTWQLVHESAGAELRFSSDGLHWDTIAHQGRLLTRSDLVGIQSLDFVDAQHGFGWLGEDTVATDDGGQTWYRLTRGPYGRPVFVDRQHGVVTGTEPAWTADGGAHWNPLAIGALQEAVASGHTIWGNTACMPGVAGCVPAIQRSTDGGATWQVITDVARGGAVPPAPEVISLTARVFAPVDDRTVFVTVRPKRGTASMAYPAGEPIPGEDMAVWRTDDAGATWFRSPIPCPDALDASVGAFDAQHAWLLCEGPNPSFALAAYRSDDGGKTWEKLETVGLPSAGSPGEIVALSAQMVVASMRASGESGYYASNDGGVTWAPVLGAYPSDSQDLMRVPGVGVFVRFTALTSASEPSSAAAHAGNQLPRNQLWFSTDGQSWVQRFVSLPVTTVDPP